MSKLSQAKYVDLSYLSRYRRDCLAHCQKRLLTRYDLKIDLQRILAIERMIMNGAGSVIFPLRETLDTSGPRFAWGIVNIQDKLVGLGLRLTSRQVCAETAFPKSEEYQAACEEINAAGGIKQARRSHRDWEVYTASKHAKNTMRCLAHFMTEADNEREKTSLKSQISEDLQILDLPSWLTDDVNAALKSEDSSLLMSVAETVFMQGLLEIQGNPYSWDLMDIPFSGNKPNRMLLEEAGLI